VARAHRKNVAERGFAKHPNACILAYGTTRSLAAVFQEPRRTSRTEATLGRPVRRARRLGSRGHEHSYERFAPRTLKAMPTPCAESAKSSLGRGAQPRLLGFAATTAKRATGRRMGLEVDSLTRKVHLEFIPEEGKSFVIRSGVCHHQPTEAK